MSSKNAPEHGRRTGGHSVGDGVMRAYDETRDELAGIYTDARTATEIAVRQRTTAWGWKTNAPLSFRWMRLPLNVPALLIASVTTAQANDPWFLFGRALIGLTVGLILAKTFLSGLVQLAWRTPGLGYLLRLAVTSTLWFLLIVLAIGYGRPALRFLFGV
ncbi:hypothetical protein ACFVV7_33880 [Streptomyces globisporus]|uniref:hypothetical protein n=1 Tax=Streptomyces globisporus TaxID=1908 RepID=UPI0036DE864A